MAPMLDILGKCLMVRSYKQCLPYITQTCVWWSAVTMFTIYYTSYHQECLRWAEGNYDWKVKAQPFILWMPSPPLMSAVKLWPTAPFDGPTLAHMAN